MNAPAMPVIIEDDDVELPLVPEGWTVDSEDRAAWAADVILSHEERCERIKRQHVSVLMRAEKELKRAREFFMPMLRAWAEKNPPKKGKTIHLSTASLSFRKKPGGLFVQDEAACVEWAEAHLPEAIRREVTRKVDIERAKLAGQQLLSAAMFEALSEAQGIEEMTEQMAGDAVMALAAQKLPPFFELRQDVDTFEVKAPGTKGVK